VIVRLFEQQCSVYINVATYVKD